MDFTYGPKIWCRAWHNAPVRRSVTEKWSVSRSRWPEKYWPSYCAGMAYITTKDAVEKILKAAEDEEWLWIDDIFVTGVLAEKAGINHVQVISKTYVNLLFQSSGYYSFSKYSRSAMFVMTDRNETWSIFEEIN